MYKKMNVTFPKSNHCFRNSNNKHTEKVLLWQVTQKNHFQENREIFKFCLNKLGVEY